MKTHEQELSQVLRKRGYRVTPARAAIWQILLQHGGHISADDLFALVHESNPKIGRMTVYRTLELLSDLALVRPIYQGTGAAHYILLEDGHHHHLICTQCHQVIEFEDCVLAEVEAAISRRFGFVVEGHLLELYGRCVNCQ
ncbi:MAG: transcriptional repressor [Anaerolineales bacterium]|nr:transcriptional repressor [Anaerolineales bacterium]